MKFHLVHRPQAFDACIVPILSAVVCPPTTPSSSEFTSDIVHVPGAKNAVADDLSRPSSPASTSAPSPPPQPVLHAVVLESSAPGFNFSALPALKSACQASIQAMLSSPSLSVVSFRFSKPPFFATCPLVLLVLWYQRFSGRVCSSLYTVFLILEYVHPGDFYLQDLCGPDCPRTLASGLEPASGVSRVKFKPT